MTRKQLSRVGLRARPLANAIAIVNSPAALAWVVSSQRMAFASPRASQARRLADGTQLFLYAGAKAGLGTSQFFGEGVCLSAPENRAPGVRVGSRVYSSIVHLSINRLAMRGAGLPMEEILGELEAFPSRRNYGLYLRRSLLELSANDARALRAALRGRLAPWEAARGSYEPRALAEPPLHR